MNTFADYNEPTETGSLLMGENAPLELRNVVCLSNLTQSPQSDLRHNDRGQHDVLVQRIVCRDSRRLPFRRQDSTFERQIAD